MTEMLSALGGALPLDPAGGSALRPPLYARAPHSPWCPPTTDPFRRMEPTQSSSVLSTFSLRRGGRHPVADFLDAVPESYTERHE